MHETEGPGPASPVPEPPPLALAIGLELVTRYHLRLVDPRDARLGELGDAYPFGAAAWTGRRAAFVGVYRPPDDPAAAAHDLEERCDAARRWGETRLAAQGADRCDVLLIAFGTVPRAATTGAAGGAVRVGAVAIDAAGTVSVLRPLRRGLPGAAELRHHVQALRQGRPAPTLAAVDLAERQTLAAGFTAPTRRAMVRRPVCTYGLIGVLVVAFIVEKAFYGNIIGGRHLVTSIDLGAVCSGTLLGPPNETVLCGPTLDNWWRLITSDFLHDPDNILHILGNSMALFLLGGLVEQLYGRLVLIGTFLLTAFLGDLFWMAATATGLTSAAPGLGASGGILGLMGLLVMLGRVQGKNVPVGIATSIRQYAIGYSVFVVVLSLFNFVQNVNNWVHVGGFLAGVLLGLVVPPAEPVGGRRLRLVERGVLVAIIAAAVVGLGVGIHHTADILANPPNNIGVG